MEDSIFVLRAQAVSLLVDSPCRPRFTGYSLDCRFPADDRITTTKLAQLPLLGPRGHTGDKKEPRPTVAFRLVSNCTSQFYCDLVAFILHISALM